MRSLLPRRAARLGAVAVAGLATAVALPTAASATTAAAITAGTTTDPAKVGLYGSADPTYDGAYRQSLALLGLTAVGATPDAAAVTWLQTQQCADGGWTAFRKDVSKACDAKTEDSNSTAMAVQALHALGKDDLAAKGKAWLVAHQNADGGLGYSPGGASDANSSALFVNALVALGANPAQITKNGKSPYDVLGTLQLACESPEAKRGAFDFQETGKTPVANDFATVQAAVAVAGKALPVAPSSQDDAVTAYPCPAPAGGLTPAQSADAAAAYLTQRLTATSFALPSAFGSGTDWTSTANAVLALVATGHGATVTAKTVAKLEANAKSWLTSPGAYGLGLLVEHATGKDSHSLGGVDLVAALHSSLTTKAAASSTPTPSTTSTASTASSASSSSAAVAGSTSPTPRSTATLAATGASRTGSLAALAGGLIALGVLVLLVAARRPSVRRH